MDTAGEVMEGVTTAGDTAEEITAVDMVEITAEGAMEVGMAEGGIVTR